MRSPTSKRCRSRRRPTYAPTRAPSARPTRWAGSRRPSISPIASDSWCEVSGPVFTIRWYVASRGRAVSMRQSATGDCSSVRIRLPAPSCSTAIRALKSSAMQLPELAHATLRSEEAPLTDVGASTCSHGLSARPAASFPFPRRHKSRRRCRRFLGNAETYQARHRCECGVHRPDVSAERMAAHAVPIVRRSPAESEPAGVSWDLRGAEGPRSRRSRRPTRWS